MSRLAVIGGPPRETSGKQQSANDNRRQHDTAKQDTAQHTDEVSPRVVDRSSLHGQ